MIDTEPVSFELRKGTKPYHGRLFLVSRVYKDTTVKENRLCDLGVLEFQPASAWVSPSFIIPKTDTTVCFIRDFTEVQNN